MFYTLAPDVAADVVAQVRRLLEGFSIDAASPAPVAAQQAVFLAKHLLRRANELQTPVELRQQRELDRMLQSPRDKATLMQLTDQAFRARLPHRAADQLIHILDVQGVPRFFSSLDRTLLLGFQSFGSYLPGVTIPMVKEKMRHETANVILPAEEELLRGYLEARQREGLRLNVNLLGEALLGEQEAERRLQRYLAALARPELEVISVKISTLYSQISPLARRHTVETLSDRLELLYRAAQKYRFERRDGTSVPKFVYLDMEEYRDKEITAEAFMRTLDRSGLEQVHAGIALQAYLPDSFATQERITAWARRRVELGGAPVTIRIVKGANLEMERVEASLRGWPPAPFDEKLDTDANYKRMLAFGLQPENLAAARLGIASHNLFALCYGLVLAVEADALSLVQFEMLEGMANHQRRALFELTPNMLLYAPACRQSEFINAIGYLVRRLDENSGAENFLRHAFRLEVESDDWNRLEAMFLDSFQRIAELPTQPRREQNRAVAPHAVLPCETISVDRFVNEPDTDWSLPANSTWGESIVEAWQSQHGSQAAEVPLVVGGEEVFREEATRESRDPSRPGVVVARFAEASQAEADRAVQVARDDPADWRNTSANERRAILYRAADTFSARRADLMGAMLAEGGKLLTESDPEVSEAIDFCRFYAESACWFGQLGGVHPTGQGVVAVVSPWNFPLAIPCGGVAAALSAGNTVILKPASDTVLIAYRLCQCFWDAGVPRSALQLLPCSGGTVGQHLVTHDQVDAVILTGGTATALAMLAAKPTLNLLAETGGKNATIVTALSDRELAIKNVIHSAFSHSGQKCSATSLLVLEEEVYHDAGFRDSLCDAIESLHVGSAWQLHTKLGPLIRPPSGDLEQALKTLEPGEEWAVMPRLHVDGNPHLIGPGVKWGVEPQSVTHCTEFFGPLLGVMSARNLHEAIDLVNATGYGLTSGLESLDDREHQLWQEGIRAGNLYINRPTTGAIVLRQPFGGMGKSSVGPGIKAGGPNYVATLMRFEEDAPQAAPTDLGDTGLDDFCEALTKRTPEFDAAEIERIVAAAQSYETWMAKEFDHPHDHFHLLGEDNFRRYLPLREVRVCVAAADTLFDVATRVLAARTAGCHTVVSSPPAVQRPIISLLEELTHAWAGRIEFVEETAEELAAVVEAYRRGRLRFAADARVPMAVRLAAAERGTYLADRPPSAQGRVELLWYFQEQSLTHVVHRYGNLGLRSVGAMREPAEKPNDQCPMPQ